MVCDLNCAVYIRHSVISQAPSIVRCSLACLLHSKNTVNIFYEENKVLQKLRYFVSVRCVKLIVINILSVAQSQIVARIHANRVYICNVITIILCSEPLNLSEKSDQLSWHMIQQ